MSRFVEATEGDDNSVIYYDAAGNKLIRYWKAFAGQRVEEASTRSWRNNNPGNLVMGDFAKRNGAIGQAGKVPGGNEKIKFAVFPDYLTGRTAQAKRLKEGRYIDLTLTELPRVYTGVKPGQPDTEEVINYRRAIKTFTNLDMDRTIRSLSDAEYEILLDAMKRHEGWREGREAFTEVKKVQGVHVNAKRVIVEFPVGDSVGRVWLSKKEAVALAEAGQLCALVVHSKGGSYLRPLFHEISFRRLVC